jgi:hypothetical protein
MFAEVCRLLTKKHPIFIIAKTKNLVWLNKKNKY